MYIICQYLDLNDTYQIASSGKLEWVGVLKQDFMFYSINCVWIFYNENNTSITYIIKNCKIFRWSVFSFSSCVCVSSYSSLVIAGLKRKCYPLFHKSKLVAANLTDWAFALRRTACPARSPSELRGGGRLWVAGCGPLRGTSLLQARVAACPHPAVPVTCVLWQDFLAQKKLPQPGFRHPSTVTNQGPQPSPINGCWSEARQEIQARLYWGLCCGEGASLFLTWAEGRGVSRGLAGGVA